MEPGNVKRVCPPMLVKMPPAKILPSACTAIETTLLLAFGLNESAKPVVPSTRAMYGANLSADALEKAAR